MSEPSTRPDYELPKDGIEHRSRLWSEHRRTRAGWLHQLLALVPPSDQPAALAAVLEIERCETEAIGANAREWMADTEQAYRTGLVHGGEDIARTLGLIGPAPLEQPATRH